MHDLRDERSIPMNCKWWLAWTAVSLIGASSVCQSSRFLEDGMLLTMGLEKSVTNDGIKSFKAASMTFGHEAYVVNVSIGTPPQVVPVQVDTGSFNLYVYGPSHKATQHHFATYDSSKSDTYKETGKKFNSKYMGFAIRGNFGTDKVKIGGQSVDNFLFGSTNDTTARKYGLFGVAPGGRPTFSHRLKQQGSIQADSFSLYLDDVNGATGGLLYGGVDTEKYTGPLYKLPVNNKSFGTSGIAIGFGDWKSDEYPGAVLDCGSALSFITPDMYNNLTRALGLKWNKKYRGYTTDKVPIGDIVFNFSGAKIHAPAASFMYTITETTNGKKTHKYKLNGLVAKAKRTPLLGISVQRFMYLAYHIDKHELAIAQASFNRDRSHIVAMTPSGIPGAVPAPDMPKYSEQAY